NVYLEDGTMVNEVLIKEGYATVTRGYSFSKKEYFIDLENQAKMQGKGLWNTEICPQ
ncbi:thermonuclease family protein, partial [Candidatus Peregrinibacteria bacterium]|nr:thermonuclease family protein [Candidatus Peregrinibacteria bacterium]